MWVGLDEVAELVGEDAGDIGVDIGMDDGEDEDEDEDEDAAVVGNDFSVALPLIPILLWTLLSSNPLFVARRISRAAYTQPPKENRTSESPVRLPVTKTPGASCRLCSSWWRNARFEIGIVAASSFLGARSRPSSAARLLSR